MGNYYEQEHVRKAASKHFAFLTPGTLTSSIRTVSADAIIKRVNRKLEELHPGSFMRLKRTRRIQQTLNLGDLYLLDGYRNFIIEHHLDLEAVAKQYKVLGRNEKIAQV